MRAKQGPEQDDTRALVYDWNAPVTHRPELVEELLWTRPGAELAPLAAARVVRQLRRLGVHRFRLRAGAPLADLNAPLIVDTPLAGPAVEAVASDRDAADAADVELLFAPERGPSESSAAVLEKALDLGFATVVLVRVGPGLDEEARGWAEAGAARVLLGSAAALDPAQVGGAVEAARAAGRPIDWRGDNRLGLGVGGALSAAESGAARLHGVLLGVGEPGASVPLDQVAVNLALSGEHLSDLSDLADVSEEIAGVVGWAIPRNYPLSGQDAFRTATGVHAAAIVKALAKGEAELADHVYSGVPAGRFGRRQVIDVGPMSGMSNVRHWLEAHGIPADERLARVIFERAKTAHRTLDAAELEAIIAEGRDD